MPGKARNPAKHKHSRVRKEMRIAEIITLCPEVVDVMVEYGLHCFSCPFGGVETLAEGCRTHGFGDEMIKELVDDINQAIAEGPKRQETLTITLEAARAIREIAVKEGREGEGLSVVVDAQGGFSLEFREEPEEGDHTFRNEKEPDVCVFVSPLMLRRIGGATIDVREGRFKLDLPSEVG